MSSVTTGVGLVSGLNYSEIADALINAQRTPAVKLETRLKNFQAVQTALGSVQATLLLMSGSAKKLADTTTFRSFASTVSDPSQLAVSVRTGAVAGQTSFQTVRLASAASSVSRGFVNTAEQTVGMAGTLVIASGGELNKPTSLELLNGGDGVRRGSIRVTNRSGVSADIDLRGAMTVEDVISGINNNESLAVRASAVGGKIVLEDRSGGTAQNLVVSEVGGGRMANDLGLKQSVASSTLTGSDVYRVTEDFSLKLLNDGNGIRQKSGMKDLQIALQDGTNLQIDLDGAATLRDVITKINTATDNGGKLTASLANGRLQLTDTTTGSGTLAVTNMAGSNVAEVLGLNTTSAGNTLTGKALAGGMNSVLVRNLRGGQGFTNLGTIELTDRVGNSASVDLSGAESLDEILHRINTAQTGGGDRLKIEARLSDSGQGLTISDTSGATASNLKIADVAGSTAAAELGIAADVAGATVDSTSLRPRYVNEATSLSTYGPANGAVSSGTFRITDSSGHEEVINFSTGSYPTLGDLIDRINSASNIDVTAKLNETGDGIELVDEAGGASAMSVVDLTGKAAKDLNLAGTSALGSDNKHHLNARRVLKIDVAATDTLTSVMAKVNAIGGRVKASIANTGSLVAPFKLSLTSTQTGAANQLVVEDESNLLGFTRQAKGQDAVLRVGADAATGFFLTSSTNTFTAAVAGVDVTALAAGSSATTVTVSQDVSKIRSVIQEFVSTYNGYVDQYAAQTTFNAATSQRAALQGEGLVTRSNAQITGLINKSFGTSADQIRALADIGVKLGSTGKLTFDDIKFQDAMRESPDAVAKLFTDTQNGFGKKLDTMLQGFTDTTTGSWTALSKTYETSVGSLSTRIDEYDARLAIRREQLIRKFSLLEGTLSSLQSQTTSLTSFIASLSSNK